MEETADRCAVARLRGAVAGLLDRVLAGLGQHGGIGDRDRLCARRLQFGIDGRNRTFGIDRDLLARQRGERGGEGGAVPNAHRIAEVLGKFGRHLLMGDEQVCRAVRMGENE